MIINALIHHSGSGISATVDAEDDLPELPTTNTTSKNGDAGDILWSNSPTPLLLSEYTNHKTAVESGRLITVALWIKISKKKKEAERERLHILRDASEWSLEDTRSHLQKDKGPPWQVW